MATRKTQAKRSPSPASVRRVTPAKRPRSATRSPPAASRGSAPPVSAATVTGAGRLSEKDVATVLKLLKDSGSVELKLTIPAEGHRAAARSIGLDVVEAQPRQAYFFDTPDLALNRAGLILRARRFQGGKGDTVVKVRPVDPATIDPDLRRSESFKVELDAMPGGFVCSASFKGSCDGSEVADVASGAMPLRSLFSKEQLAFFDARAPKKLRMDKLVVLGPILLLRAKHRAKELGRNLVVELWIYPDGSHVLEISTKCEPREAFQVSAEFRSFLAERGIDAGSEQDSKTRVALQYFKKRLDAGLPL